MIYAQFYQESTGYIAGTIPPQFSLDHKKTIPACGDRAVIVIDGRLRKSAQINIARSECRKRGFIGFSMFKGETFNRSTEIREIELL